MGCCAQDLLERHMGMWLPEMQEMAEKPPEERDKHRLKDAHLPERGFYLVKCPIVSPQEHQSPPYWRKLTSLLRQTQSTSQHSFNSAHCARTGAVVTPGS